MRGEPTAVCDTRLVNVLLISWGFANYPVDTQINKLLRFCLFVFVLLHLVYISLAVNSCIKTNLPNDPPKAQQDPLLSSFVVRSQVYLLVVCSHKKLYKSDYFCNILFALIYSLVFHIMRFFSSTMRSSVLYLTCIGLINFMHFCVLYMYF